MIKHYMFTVTMAAIGMRECYSPCSGLYMPENNMKWTIGHVLLISPAVGATDVHYQLTALSPWYISYNTLGFIISMLII